MVPVLLNGTSGDVNNVDVREPKPLSGAAQAERVAGMLAGETIKVVERLRPASEVRLRVASERLRFRRKRVTPEDVALAERILAVPDDVPDKEVRQRAGIGESGPFSWVVGQPLPPNVLRAYARECRYLAELPEERETEITALRMGDGALVGLPGEVFAELGLTIKAGSPFGMGSVTAAMSLPNRASGLIPMPEYDGATLVASLANDYVGYVPTRRAQEEEGGYETWAARSALPAAGTGEAMVEAAVRLLGKLAAE